MIADVPIQAIIDAVGKNRLGQADLEKLAKLFKFKIRDTSLIVDPSFQVGSSLSNLVRKFQTLFCSVTDTRAPHEYAHAVIIHDQMLYDPWAGVNPMWPWSRHIWCAQPVGEDCMNDYKGG